MWSMTSFFKSNIRNPLFLPPIQPTTQRRCTAKKVFEWCSLALFSEKHIIGAGKGYVGGNKERDPPAPNKSAQRVLSILPLRTLSMMHPMYCVSSEAVTIFVLNFSPFFTKVTVPLSMFFHFYTTFLALHLLRLHLFSISILHHTHLQCL
jgi:hypothetical protein